MATPILAEGLPPILDRLDQVDGDWLHAILTRAGITDLPPITKVTLRAIGAGNASDTQRAAITYATQAPSAPHSLICKFHPASEESRAQASQIGTFVREVGAYQAIVDARACRVPRAFLIAGDDQRINLVMEDLSETGRLGDQITGCGLLDAQAVIVQLADLHASFYPLSVADAPGWMMTMAEMGSSWAPLMVMGAARAPARFGDRLDAVAYATITECAALAAHWYRLPARRLTLTHGDPRVDNILFDTDGAILIDWQVAGLRNPMYDVAYFLTSSLPVVDRRSHERALLAVYLNRLGGRIAGYDEAEMLAEYRLSMIANLTLDILSIISLPDTPVLDRLLLVLLERATAAVQDWDALSAIRHAG